MLLPPNRFTSWAKKKGDVRVILFQLALTALLLAGGIVPYLTEHGYDARHTLGASGAQLLGQRRYNIPFPLYLQSPPRARG
jgi:hypothetical protein